LTPTCAKIQVTNTSPVTLIQLFVATIYILSLGILYQICSYAYSSVVSLL